MNNLPVEADVNRDNYTPYTFVIIALGIEAYYRTNHIEILTNTSVEYVCDLESSRSEDEWKLLFTLVEPRLFLKCWIQSGILRSPNTRHVKSHRLRHCHSFISYVVMWWCNYLCITVTCLEVPLKIVVQHSTIDIKNIVYGCRAFVFNKYYIDPIENFVIISVINWLWTSIEWIFFVSIFSFFKHLHTTNYRLHLNQSIRNSTAKK